jgi:uncharacterized protein YlxP (DUF503 family)
LVQFQGKGGKPGHPAAAFIGPGQSREQRTDTARLQPNRYNRGSALLSAMLLVSALTMPIGKLTLEVSIPHAQSLKDRRQVIRSLKDKLRHTFNLSIAELNEGGTLWNQATLAVAVASSSHQMLTQHLESIDRAAHRLSLDLSAEIADSYAEILAD